MTNLHKNNISLNEYAAYSWILCEYFNNIEKMSLKEIKAILSENMNEILENYGFKNIDIKYAVRVIRILGKYERIFTYLDEVLCDNVPLKTTLKDLERSYYAQSK